MAVYEKERIKILCSRVTFSL